MRGTPARRRHARVAATLCTGLIALAGGCSNGATPQAKAAVDAGEPCVPPAYETGCVCSAEQPRGTRQCLASTMIWTQCVCPPPAKAGCLEGQPVICDLCRGEVTRRMTTCLRDGTFDCACATPSRDMDGG